MNILEVDGLCKNFGSQVVLRNLSFTVPEHKVYGFIGANGAGKTTTMKTILGLLKADQGRISVCGQPVTYGRSVTNRYIGYLPDVPEYYNFMTPLEYLKLCGDITGMSKALLSGRQKKLIEMVGLQKVEKKRIGGFSRGMKQRLGIAQALLNEPKLLICDEPTSALDPLGRKEILDILQEVKNTTTVLFSTHILSDVERICDHVALLNEGTIMLSGTLDEIKRKYVSNCIRVEFLKESDLIEFQRLFLIGKEIKVELQDDRTMVIHTSEIEKTQEAVMAILYQNQWMPRLIERQEPTLEHLFLEVVR